MKEASDIVGLASWPILPTESHASNLQGERGREPLATIIRQLLWVYVIWN
jgi:hypothetical protein